MNSPKPEQFGYTEQLHRSLNTPALTIFGLNYMIPLSPAIFFGYVLIQSGGTVALPFIIAGIAIFFTAMSYAIMVRHFPLSGSLYSFVSQVWGKRLGFLSGWVLLLDYLFITTVTSMSAADYIIQLVPIPYVITLLLFILLTGSISLFGIQLVAWTGLLFFALTEAVVLSSFMLWAHAIIKKAGHFSALWNLGAFHFSSLHALMGATSLAAASYLGFDAITTLSEEAKNPTRSVPKAIFLCVLIGGLGMVVTGYLVLLACPDWQTLSQDPNWQAAALFYITKAAGGSGFATVYSLGFIISMGIFNIVATTATARLLFGMGRDSVVLKKFSLVHPRWKTPYWNVLFIMALSFVVGSVCNIAEIASLVNYGALLGFACLNLAVISLYFQEREVLYTSPVKSFIYYVMFPAIGFIVVSWLFLSLNRQTLIFGTIWLTLGIGYLIMRSLAGPRG